MSVTDFAKLGAKDAKIVDTASTILDDVERQTSINRLRKRAEQTSVSNFDLRNSNDAFAALMMKSIKSQTVWDHQKITIYVQYIHVQERDAIEDERGELKDRVRTTFIDREGNVFHSGSAVVMDVALMLLETNIGRKMFDPPLTITFEKIKTGPTTQYQAIFVDMDSLRLLQDIPTNGDGAAKTGQGT